MKQVVIGIAEMKVSNQPGELLVTKPLGVCIALAVYDPKARVGGILHYMLPDSCKEPASAQRAPFLFADTGIPKLLNECCRLGAVKSRMVVKVAGGGQVLGGTEHFNIGRRNYLALRKVLFKNNVLICGEHVGGHKARVLHLDLATGRVWVKTTGKEIIEL